jgi:excinuclease UvrABC nuclease subunit
MEFRPVQDKPGQYSSWVRELGGKSGVYVIKEAGFLGEVIYVGESHSGHLKRTLVRHFQNWEGPTSGPTFQKSAVVVAVVRTKPERAVAMQDALIAEFLPRLNSEGKPKSWLEKLFG